MMRTLIYLLMTIFLSFGLSSKLIAADCVLQDHQCVDGPSTKIISGYPVTRDCWEYKDTYLCESQSTTSDCQPMIDRGCSQLNATCIENSELSGSCVLYEKKYQCVAQTGQTRTVKDCGTQTFCTDGSCFDTSYTNDGDITQVISGMEAMREAGVYFDPNSTSVFNGKSSKCTRTLGGIFNCCGKKVQAGATNNSWMPNIAYSVGKETIRWLGSNYMYDALFAVDAPNFMFQAASSVVPLDSSLDFAPSFYGITVGLGTATQGAYVLGQVGANQLYLAFDPASFALQIGLLVVQELMKCSESEQILSVKRGSNLCTGVGSYCSKKVLGVCVQKTQSYCCYNSKIARIINQHGKAQLGTGYGSAKNPNCAGFTVNQLQMLDFSSMDFSEMTADIKNKMRNVDTSFAADRANSKVPNSGATSIQPYKTQNYFAP